MEIAIRTVVAFSSTTFSGVVLFLLGFPGEANRGLKVYVGLIGWSFHLKLDGIPDLGALQPGDGLSYQMCGGRTEPSVVSWNGPETSPCSCISWSDVPCLQQVVPDASR